MDTSGINFTVIEEAFGAAESKEQLYGIFVASATGKLDSEIHLTKGDNCPEILKKIPSTLGISNEKASVLVLSLHNLLKLYVSKAMTDETELATAFPENMKKSIKSFLFKAMREVAPLTKTYIQD